MSAASYSSWSLLAPRKLTDNPPIVLVTDGAPFSTNGSSFLDRACARQPALHSQPGGAVAIPPPPTHETTFDHRRDRTGKGSHRASDSRAEPPPRPKSRKGELRRRCLAGPPRKRAFGHERGPFTCAINSHSAALHWRSWALCSR